MFVADLPGMGDSGLPPVTEPVEDLVRISGTIIASGVEGLLGRSEPVHIVGFSFGSMVGAHAAARLGTQVATFTMVGASGLGLAFAGPGRLRKPEPEMTETTSGSSTATTWPPFSSRTPRTRTSSPSRCRSGTRARFASAPTRRPSHRFSRGAPRHPRAPRRHLGRPGPIPSRARRARGAASPVRPRHPHPHRRRGRHWVPYEGAEAFNRCLLELLDRGVGPRAGLPGA